MGNKAKQASGQIHPDSSGLPMPQALVSLLLQPEENLPAVIILDEPELGLHPYAINVVAGLLQSVSQHAQVILATQSATFVDCFHPEQIIVVDRPGRESRFNRLDPEKLKDWLEEYSVAELWEKNVIGGRPTR
jgi:predicted ATPase